MALLQKHLQPPKELTDKQREGVQVQRDNTTEYRRDGRARDWLYPVAPGDQDWSIDKIWREDRPYEPGSSGFRARVAAILTLMASGMAQSRIAKRFRVSEDRISWYLNEARQAGDIFPNQTAPEVLDSILTPLALETMLFHLGRKDKSTALKHLEGRGLYQAHQAIKNTGPAAATAFKVAFSTPEGGEVTLQAGQVLGVVRGPEEETQE